MREAAYRRDVKAGRRGVFILYGPLNEESLRE